MVSIVIPIYNVEKYLRRCLDSVIRQTYQDIEIIAVSDGSPDNSEQIVKEYEKNDKRIKLVVIEHSGTSAAVAAGVKVANGEYVAFIDPDDYVGDDFIANFIEEIEDCDVVCMGYYTQSSLGVAEAKANLKIDQYFTNKDLEALSDDTILNHELMTVSRWSKLYKKSLLDNFMDTYGELKLSVYEDWVFIGLMLLFIKKYKASNKINSYYYCTNLDSVMRSVKSIEDYCANIEKFKKADKVMNNYSNNAGCFIYNSTYSLAINYIDIYVKLLDKKAAYAAMNQILNNTDFRISLPIVNKIYKDRLSVKQYIEFKVRYVLCSLKKIRTLYFIKKRRHKK